MLEMFMMPEMGTRVTTAMVNYVQMLSLPNMALSQLVQQELSENPALEELEFESDQSLSEADLLRLIEPQHGSKATLHSDASGTETGDAVDPLLFVASAHTLADALISDLRASLPLQDHPIALLVVESLDEHGFLKEDATSLARTLSVAPERVEAVVQRLKELEPVGIATRNVQECLLAQLAYLECEGIAQAHAQTIVRDYLHDLGAHRYQHIARQLHIDVTAVEEVRDFLQMQCCPYPVQADSGLLADFHTTHNQPDVAIIAQNNQCFRAEVLHTPHRQLRISSTYRDMASQTVHLNEEERTHVRSYMERARTFLANLRQRQDTLQRISEAIILHQEEFLRYGVRHLHPLTRAEIAAQIGVHESTVSRATAQKIVVLPNGRLMPFAEFFQAARPVQDALRELVEQETTPLSDAELARQLSQQGYPVARRTVAKYRDQLRILPSRLRTPKQQPSVEPTSYDSTAVPACA